MFKNIKGDSVRGYEIHEGTTELNGTTPFLEISGKGKGNNNDGSFDGACEGNVFGTYFHGIFHNYNLRREFLNYIRDKKGLELKFGEDPYESSKYYSINRLAEIVEQNIDMDFVDKMIFKD